MFVYYVQVLQSVGHTRMGVYVVVNDHSVSVLGVLTVTVVFTEVFTESHKVT